MTRDIGCLRAARHTQLADSGQRSSMGRPSNKIGKWWSFSSRSSRRGRLHMRNRGSLEFTKKWLYPEAFHEFTIKWLYPEAFRIFMQSLGFKVSSSLLSIWSLGFKKSNQFQGLGTCMQLYVTVQYQGYGLELGLGVWDLRVGGGGGVLDRATYGFLGHLYPLPQYKRQRRQHRLQHNNQQPSQQTTPPTTTTIQLLFYMLYRLVYTINLLSQRTRLQKGYNWVGQLWY